MTRHTGCTTQTTGQPLSQVRLQLPYRATSHLLPGGCLLLHGACTRLCSLGCWDADRCVHQQMRLTTASSHSTYGTSSCVAGTCGAPPAAPCSTLLLPFDAQAAGNPVEALSSAYQQCELSLSADSEGQHIGGPVTSRLMSCGVRQGCHTWGRLSGAVRLESLTRSLRCACR